MEIHPLDIAVIVWALVGTFILRWRLQLLALRQYHQSGIVVTAIVFALVPLAVFRLNVAQYSTLGIVAATLAVFWFAILAIRSCRMN